ncbi:hypothetical protein Poly24_40100 [Rosistilla carotiformis]|uniref:Uncharacterized protein n=1 Tax=Rosistilla carotiformis TaxID=2528017 RepID=A0A518JXL9_9BACT|nr:hypothetical protein [Rosistilla carotiformis]QDV70290.1 hypothetical protein Poly24_40100 [Rosistilla carotiformis]
MSDDIEAFLRRAAQRRKEQAAKKAAPVAKPRPEYTDSRAERKIREIRPEDLVEPEIVEDYSAGISQLTNRHLQGEHLANAVGQADDKMDAHIQKVFDHQVGQLPNDPAPSAAQSIAEGEIAKTLIALLQSSQGVQQAFLLHDIIERPTHRWD